MRKFIIIDVNHDNQCIYEGIEFTNYMCVIVRISNHEIRVFNNINVMYESVINNNLKLKFV